MIPLPEIGDKFNAFTVRYGNRHRDGPFVRIKAPKLRLGSIGPSRRHVIYGKDAAGNELCFWYYYNNMNWCFTFEVLNDTREWDNMRLKAVDTGISVKEQKIGQMAMFPVDKPSQDKPNK